MLIFAFLKSNFIFLKSKYQQDILKSKKRLLNQKLTSKAPPPNKKEETRQPTTDIRRSSSSMIQTTTTPIGPKQKPHKKAGISAMVSENSDAIAGVLLMFKLKILFSACNCVKVIPS